MREKNHKTAREILATATRFRRFTVRTLDSDGSISAVLVTADGQRIQITNMLDSDREHVSRRVSIRSLLVPILSGGHSVRVTTYRPGKKPDLDIVRAEEAVAD